MEDVADFFAAQKFQIAIANLARRLSDDTLSFETNKQFIPFILSALAFFKTNPHDFDVTCQFNIKLIGDRFYSDISDSRIDEVGIENIFTSCYRFLSELAFYKDGNFPGNVAYEVHRTLEKIQYEASEIPARVKNQLVYADNFMPVALAKSYLNKADFGLIKSFDEKHSGLGKVVEELNTKLEASKKEVGALHDALKNYENAFNFVGLHKGFNDIARSKRRSSYLSICIMAVLACLMILPFLWKIWHVVNNESSSAFNTELFMAFLGYDLLLLYFFRVVFQGYKSVKGQLVQLDLRKAVCQFIQSYADYAVKIKGSNPALLEKFESLVFSGIVANEENIPSTFDGVEQLAKLFEKIRAP
ncbi:hypothetical protein [Pseudomonas kribbensis]|uniref:Uncharacterized protein n=1 Tax=Pseudomonas kribbensis TaxID=1628086 RepID=A0A4Y8VE58_9PSED|nr:hypothetical protein [Pseudomonas kribbensis]TFH79010.1 hypothetical protein E4J90_18675 [Pseudomonas kribbensis]